MKNDYVSTGYVMNESRNRILFIYHKKLKKWLPPGGHIKANELPHEAAIREVFEETGIIAEIIDASTNLFLNLDIPKGVETQLPAPYWIIHEYIEENIFEESHMHVDFIFLMCTNEMKIRLQLSEVNEAKWLTKDEVYKCDTFEKVKIICKIILNDL